MNGLKVGEVVFVLTGWQAFVRVSQFRNGLGVENYIT